MSYHDGPNHGSKATTPPARRSRQIRVLLKGGPRDGSSVTYGQPLPKTLVVSSEDGYQDYERKPNTTTYIHKFDMKVKHEETVADSIGLLD